MDQNEILEKIEWEQKHIKSYEQKNEVIDKFLSTNPSSQERRFALNDKESNLRGIALGKYRIKLLEIQKTK